MKKEWRRFLVVYILGLLGVLMVTLWGRKTVSVMAQDQMSHRHTIIIDAGHGGVDGGATSCTGVLESKLNLEIALRLEDLSHLLGYNTVMIRTQDISIYTKGTTIAQKKISDLKERVRIINSTENAILLSIHQNHFPDGRYYGAQVFHNGTPESMVLAQGMQKSFLATVNPESNRKSKKSTGVYLLEHISCTGVLIECGFLSNYAEESKLNSSAYQKQLCCVMITSVSQYLNT